MRLSPGFSVAPSRPRSRPASPIGVCFVIDRLSRAGTESQLLALIRNLDRKRFRPGLCLLNGGDDESRGLWPADCPTIDLRLRGLLRPEAVRAAVRLARFWREHESSVVQTYFLDSTYFAVPLARLCGIQRVVRVRNNVGYFLTPRHSLLGRAIGRIATITLTNSESGRAALLASEALPASRVRVIENGVDVERFPPGLPFEEGRPEVVVGTVANLRPVKNIDGLIRAAAVVCAARPNVRFEVAGEGPERPRLEAEIAAAGLADRFRLVGSVGDVPGFLARLDVAVLCSHSESMSNSLLEYMAAGRAIVATDVGANARLIRPGVDGLIVPPGDGAALARAIETLVGSHDLGRRLAQSARARVCAQYSRLSMVQEFEALYDALAR